LYGGFDEVPGSYGGSGDGMGWKALGLAVGDGVTTTATDVEAHCLDLTASDFVNEQPTEVVVATTTPIRPRVTSVTSAMAMTRR
jgi:hypothetical protein